MFSNNRLTRPIAAGAAVVVLAAGGISLANSGSGTASSPTANVAQAAAPSQAAPTGQVPKNWTRGSGTLITGAAADKAKAAAVAAGYRGTVNRVLQLSDGSYAVHFTANPSGPHHVFVSKDFKVTGTA
ncbi:MAG TPA: hypothetical protein VGC98_02440 [Thermoleophilaceae bacterium]|jgi:hypothetical protein